MIKTKSIQAIMNINDGTRICVMRWIRHFYEFDEGLRELAPSIILLNNYKYKRITWDVYKIRYLMEMEKQSDLIDQLKKKEALLEK